MISEVLILCCLLCSYLSIDSVHCSHSRVHNSYYKHTQFPCQTGCFMTFVSVYLTLQTPFFFVLYPIGPKPKKVVHPVWSKLRETLVTYSKRWWNIIVVAMLKMLLCSQCNIIHGYAVVCLNFLICTLHFAGLARPCSPWQQLATRGFVWVSNSHRGNFGSVYYYQFDHRDSN